MVLRPRCLERGVLTGAELYRLHMLPKAVYMLEPDGLCELEREHTGAHLWLVQSSSTDCWWLRWDGTGRQLLRLAECLHEGPPAPDGEEQLCLLAVGHPGAHTYQMVEGGRTGRSEDECDLLVEHRLETYRAARARCSPMN